MATVIENSDAFTTGAKPLQWSVAEFNRLNDAGFFAPEARLELIEGTIIEMAPIGPDHGEQVNRLTNELAYRLYKKAIVSTQNPVQLGSHSAPQPDLAVLRWRDDFYHGRLPQPDEVLLLIEVADSSLDYDRNTKLPLYARFHIPELWLVNLPERAVEVYREPQDNRYKIHQRRQQSVLSGSQLADIRIDIGELFRYFG